MTAARIVVIGGGISGLATAHFARQTLPDAVITILEDTDRLGGNIRTLHVGGIAVEAGPDAVVIGRPEVARLFAQLGLDTELASPSEEGARVLVARDGALLCFPDGLVFGMPTRLGQLVSTPLLSTRGKLRAALDLFIPEGPVVARSVGALIDRRLGREVKDRLVEPMVGGIFAADIDRLDPSGGLAMLASARGSLIRAMASVRRPKGSPVRAPARGMSRLVDALACAIEPSNVRLRSGARRVVARDGGFSVETRDGVSFPCERVVLAVPPHAASALVVALDPELAAATEDLSSASTASVVFVFPAGTTLPAASGFLVPRSEGKATLAATFVNAKWGRRSTTGEVVVRVLLGGARAPDLVSRSDDDALRALALGDLRAYLRLPDPSRAVVVRYHLGTPQPEMGHAARLALVRGAAARHPGLSLVSAAYEGPGIAGCIAQAARVGATMASVV